MPARLTCPQGHQWELPEESAPLTVKQQLVCPVCGVSTAPSLPAVDETAAPAANSAAATTGLVSETLPVGSARTADPHLEAATLAQTERPPATGVEEEAVIPGHTILGVLGRGGMGVVYKAQQVKLKRLVALKMILAGAHAGSEELNRFRIEAEAVASLQHPNIVQIYDMGDFQGRPYFSLEFVEGGTLAQKLNGAPLPVQQAAHLVETLALAVHYAHEHGIIHRDLKPANVLLTNDGTPKITDFGLAKRQEKAISHTHTGSILGTPSYMSPEQATGRSTAIGPATDVYALGAILYELLTGRPPFKAETLVETLDLVRHQEAVPLRRCRPAAPRDMETICAKCLQKAPGRRYASAADLAGDLRRFLAGEPILARPVSRWERSVKLFKRRPALMALMGVSGVAVLALATATILWFNLRRGGTSAGQENSQSTFLHQYSEAEVLQAGTANRRALFDIIRNRGRNPRGWILANLAADAPPEEEVWLHSQALCALISTPDVANSDLQPFLASLDLPFAADVRIEAGGMKYGWLAHVGSSYTEAEPALWTAAALAAALGRPGWLSGESRRRCLEHFAYTHEVVQAYRRPQFTGGWNMFARQAEPAQHNTYTTALALLALLETRHAGLGWEGSTQRRDELLAATAGWLAAQFHSSGNSSGWHYGTDASDVVLEGLTLQIYGELLRADIEAGIPVPPRILEQIPKHLAGCAGRTLDYPNQAGSASVIFTDHMGKQQLGKQSLLFAWYPWGVNCCTWWLHHAQKHGASPADITQVRSVLGHLLVDLGEEAETRNVTGYTFIPAERLYCLATLPPAVESDRAR